MYIRRAEGGWLYLAFIRYWFLCTFEIRLMEWDSAPCPPRLVSRGGWNVRSEEVNI